jgi:hypothetical protein
MPLVSAVRVPTSVSRIEPVVFVARTVDVSVFSVCDVKLNVKVPPVPAVVGTVMLTLIEPVNMEMVVGVMVDVALSGTIKFPDDGPLDPGLVRVFAFVAGLFMRAPLFRVAAPLFPPTNVKPPEAAMVAYAGLSAVDASSNAPNPVAPSMLVLTFLIFRPSQLVYSVAVDEASVMPIEIRPTDGLCFNALPDRPRAPSR